MTFIQVNFAPYTLSDPFVAGSTIAVQMASNPFSRTKSSAQSVVYGLGSKYPAVFTDTRYSDVIDVEFSFIGTVAYDAFIAMYDSLHTLLFRSPLWNKSWYVQVYGSMTVSNPFPVQGVPESEIWFSVKGKLIEVAAPNVSS